MNHRERKTEILRPVMLYQALADSLRERIFKHELMPGEPLDECRLASSYGVSRTPLREALKVLASEGLVELRVGQCCFVARLAPQDLVQIFDILELLEGFAVRQASLSRTRVEAGADFYQDLIDASGNQYLPDLVERLAGKLRLSFGPFFDTPGMQPPADVQAALSLLIGTGALEEALDVARDYATQRRHLGIGVLADETPAPQDAGQRPMAGEEAGESFAAGIV